MGARSPIQQRPRRGGLKCEFCSRSFPSALSLRRHQNSLHASALKEKERRALSKTGKIQKGVKTKVVVKAKPKLVKTKPKVLPTKTPEKSVRKDTAPKQTETVVNPPKVKEETKEEQTEKKVEMDLRASTEVRKVEFKCPICIKMFPVYFSAMKHIQRHHSNKVSTSEPIKPVRTESCIFCNTMVPSDMEDHKCDSSHDLTGLLLTYVCTGCDQKFTSMKHFDIHISGVHSEGVESMFFPTADEFNKWKNTMEEQTKSSYLMMGKYQYKQIYRCSKTTVKEDDSSPVHFCPSTLIFQEFTKGIQVHFYKEHFGHPCPKYVLRDKYKKYSLTDMLNQAMGYLEMTNVRTEENDLYCQFKKLMESIVLDAAKINVEKLKTLIGKALEMISVLKNYNADDDDESLNLSLSSNRDHELAQALEALNNVSKSGKRPINTSIEVIPAKRLNKTETLDKSPILQKSIASKPTVNKFSLADDRDDQKILKELDGDNANKVSCPLPVPIRKTIESPSFNDTYKNFVEKNLKTPDIKTSTSLASKNSFVEKNLKTPDTKTSTSLAGKNSGTVATKKKVTVKTKMGQYKPGNSPKKAVQNGTETSARASRSSAGKPSDIKYEVKEQENDCNILILKI